MSFSGTKGYLTKPKPGTMLNPLHPLSQGLVGYWLFNEGAGSQAHDISGHGNHGTLTNMLPNVQGSGWCGSKYGGGLHFDGVNDYVNLNTDSSIVNNTIGTITVKANFSTLDYNTSLLGYGGGNTATPGIFFFTVRDSGGSDYRLYVLTQVEGSAGWDIVHGDTTITAGKDYTFSISSNGTAWTLYVDDEIEALTIESGTNSGEWFGDVNPGGVDILTIGTRKYDGTFDDYLNGCINNVYLYNRALSAAEIEQLYYNPFCNLLQVPIRRYSVIAAPPVGAIMNQFQRANIGADLYDGCLVV